MHFYSSIPNIFLKQHFRIKYTSNDTLCSIVQLKTGKRSHSQESWSAKNTSTLFLVCSYPQLKSTLEN